MSTITFQTNIKKILEAILYVASKCSNIGFHSICKMFFYADIYHLNKYGRPVTGDNYRALKFGPVPSTTYEILKQDPLIFEGLDEIEPFIVQKIGSKPIVIPQREPDIEYFSISDIEALDYVIKEYADKSFNELTDLSHKHPAWENAGINGVMNYEDFIFPKNTELIKELKENSKYISL